MVGIPFSVIPVHKIVSKVRLNPEITLMEIHAPMVARKIKPGQFVVIRIDEKGERIPLTKYTKDVEKGTVTVVFMKVGKSTRKLDTLEEGDHILDFVGPLGKPAHIKNYGTVVCVAGGVGTPEICPVVRALKEAGNEVITIAGFRCKDRVILEDKIKEHPDEVIICTDDGSYCKEGFTTDALRELLESGKKIDLVHCVGPVIMMKLISDLTKEYNVPCKVSLNSIMLDATGMCGSCRVNVSGTMKLTCVDGPEFDGHEVDFGDLMNRLKMFNEEERVALERFTGGA